MPVKCIPPYTPLLYRPTGVCRGIPIILIFAPEHRLWVLVRTEAVLMSTHYLYFGAKIIIIGLPLQTPVFLEGYTFHEHVFLMIRIK